MSSDRKKVLIIDDEKDICFFVKANLQLFNDYKVIVANNGRMGILSANLYKPDLILLDIMMPGIDGFEVLKRLKEHNLTSSIPVIMLTARSDDEFKEKAASLYNEYYIVKPFKMEFLKSKIDEILSRKTASL